MNVVQSERAGVHERHARRGRRPARGDTPPPPVRERRAVKPAEERRKDILDAALRLFASKGFADTSVSDIAAEAGMATGTVYLYFPSKEHVLQGLHELFGEQNEQAIAAVAVDAIDRANTGEVVDYREVIDMILDTVAQSFRDNWELVAVCTKYRPELVDPEGHTPDHLSIVSRAIEAGVQLGLIHTSDPEMTSYLFDAALAYNLHTHITFGDPPDMDRLVAAAKEMFHKTLALPAELAPRAKKPARGSRRRTAAR
ncbi:MAG: TetR/AcrR family transcriptional regulator [Actinomycetota bacterium]